VRQSTQPISFPPGRKRAKPLVLDQVLCFPLSTEMDSLLNAQSQILWYWDHTYTVAYNKVTYRPLSHRSTSRLPFTQLTSTYFRHALE